MSNKKYDLTKHMLDNICYATQQLCFDYVEEYFEDIKHLKDNISILDNCEAETELIKKTNESFRNFLEEIIKQKEKEHLFYSNRYAMVKTLRFNLKNNVWKQPIKTQKK